LDLRRAAAGDSALTQRALAIDDRQVTSGPAAATSLLDGRLPYGPLLSRLLRPTQRGFLAVNGLLVAPALRLGLGRLLGNPMTGHLMVLRTRGRVTARIREAPLGYVIRDGAVWCVAGYGRSTPWYRNLLANPSVEVVLPGRTVQGLATPVEDQRAWAAAFRDLIGSFGVLGRLVVGGIDGLTDEQLRARFEALPIVRIDPVAPAGRIRPGIWDRGPVGAAVIAGWATLAGAIFLAATRRRRTA
jgi:deazaflavin-dependent oxidoreductase (nitroreductase family)